MPNILYTPPEVEVIYTMVETGFAGSTEAEISIPVFDEDVWI